MRAVTLTLHPAVDRILNIESLIPGGTLWMGAQKTHPTGRGYDAEAWDDEAPVHRVGVPAFVVGRYPVTVAEYEAFLGAAPEGYLDARHWDPAGWKWRAAAARTAPEDWEDQRPHRNRPVTGVSWYEAAAYCHWVGGRLPTEAEWEWVARGAKGRKYPWGSEPPTDGHANFGGRVGTPTPVGIYPGDVHEFEVRDLAGNVWEWCDDLFGAYTEGASPQTSASTTGTSRVLRGGSFYSFARVLRGAYRYIHTPPEFDNPHVGFRVVWSVAGGQT